MMKRRVLFILYLFVPLFALAQLTDGRVYNFENIGNAGKSMTVLSSGYIGIGNKNTGDYSQLWYAQQVETGVFYMRNLFTGQYLRSSNGQSAKWTMVNTPDDNCKLKCFSAGNGHTLRATNTTGNYHYMHYGANNDGCIVGWEINASATQWTIAEVSVNASDLQNNWDRLSDANPSLEQIQAYSASLAELFNDKSCTQLKSTYDNMSVESLRNVTAFQNLPQVLQNMVLKVKGNNWDEANASVGKGLWDSEYAQRFRVQLYEPYNEVGAAATALGINAHTNLNNPTGIYANSFQPLYIMVEGTIKDGAELYIESWSGHGKASGGGTRLSEGLNVVPVFFDNTATCINYIVNTFDTSNGKRGKDACKRKLSDYPDLKIHIEGGHINGYYNKVGDALWGEGDNSADWDYYAARANQTDLTILGKYITLQFPLKDEDTMDNDGNLNKGMNSYLTGKNVVESVIDEWDNVMLWERLLMGVVDEATVQANAKKSPYSDAQYVIDYIGNNGDAYACDYGDYYNVHGLSFGTPNGYMYGSWDHCGYNFNTMGGVIASLPTNAGSHWGPEHEIGHQHQGPLNMRGLTEVTNNLFSNVVLWYYGKSTSRYNGTEGALFNVLNAFNTKGADFFTNNIWAQTHMYYKLFLYYHVLGKNPKFYPVLFEMLRQDPMTIQYEQSGVTSLLHFYKKCCLASGNDLTEFFRAHGFFRAMKDRFVGDYSNANYNMTWKQIETAIAEVKALKLPENLAVLYINDATAEPILSHRGGNLDFYSESKKCAELGSYASFKTASDPNYTYFLLFEEMQLEGTGGIGFAIVDEKGELLAFADNKKFAVSPQCIQLVNTGQAKVMAVKADGSLVEVQKKNATNDDLKARLGEVLKAAQEILSVVDPTGKNRPGFYLESHTSDLKEAYDKAKKAYDESDAALYTVVYDNLYNEYNNVRNSHGNNVPFVPNSTYILTNKKYPNLSMGLEGSALKGVATDTNSKSQQWTLEAAKEEDTYYIKNVSVQKYLGELKKSSKISADVSDKDSALPYKLFDLGNGMWAFECMTDENRQSLHMDGGKNIVGWGHRESDNDGSWWYLTATSHDETQLARAELQSLLNEFKTQLYAVADIEQDSALTESSYYSNAECGNTPYPADKFKGYYVLCDNDMSTFFHSDYSGSAPNEDHYIRMDLGDAKNMPTFNLYYVVHRYAPTILLIEGSHDTTNWNTILSLTKEADGLPTGGGASHTISDIPNPNSYRYIRFRVQKTDEEAKSNGHYFFALRELGITFTSLTIKEEYSAIDPSELRGPFNSYLSTVKLLSQSLTKQEYETAYSALLVQYEALLAAIEKSVNSDIPGKKAELLALINETKALIDSCGTVTFTEEVADVKVELQTLDAAAAGHLYCNAPFLSDPTSSDYSPVEKSYWLLDNNHSTFLHTDWSSNAPDEDHFLRVYVSEEGTARFRFNYSTRGQGGTTNRGNPTQIVVEGSSEAEGEYTVIKTLSSLDAENPLPTSAELKHYNSADLGDGTSYKYLRFRVTANEANEKANGHHWFYISEFGLTRAGSSEAYSVQLKDNVGNVTEELLIATYKEVQKAQIVYDMATTEAQLLVAINDLQQQFDTLLNARYINVQVSSVALDSTSVTLTEGESVTLTATVTPHYAYNRKVVWNTSAPAVATVDAKGKVVALTPGTAVITAKAGNKTATCTVTVEKKVIPVSVITLSHTSATLVEGESLTLSATVTPADATDKTVTWSSSNTAVATVDAKGLVKAIAPGTAVITAKAGDKSATCTLTVEKKVIPVSGISLNHTSATLVEGESLTLTATVAPADATDKTVTWSSSDETVATVDASGLVKAIAPGTAVITAKAGDKSATCTLTVEKKVIPVSGITLSYTSATLVEGESLTLSATVTPADATDKTVTWSSSDETVATVDANGLLKAIAPGTAVITAKAGDKSATCTLTVEKKVIPVEEITLSHTSATLVEGESLTLSATVTPADATDKTVTWSSSDETVATVDANGLVKAIAPGTAVITAKAGDKSATCTLTVEKKVIPVEGITLSHTSATLVEGDSITLTATVTPADATDKTVTWSSSDETVAAVDANGKVVAIAPGTAVITAQAGDFTATCEIVVSAIDSIEDLKALGDNVVVYDLEGRRIFDVDNLKPGLYIVNGKRVLIGKRVN